MCARAGGRGGRGGRGAAGRAPPGPLAGAACCRAGSAARGPTWRPGNSRGGARPLTLKGTRGGGRGGPAPALRVPARPPAAHKAEPGEKERPERVAPLDPAPRAPLAPSISPARQLTSRREQPQRPVSPRQTSAPLPPPSARSPAPSPALGPRAGPPHPCLAPLLPRGRLGALGCCPRLRAKVDGVGGLHCMACPRTRPPRDRAPPRGLARRVEASLQSAWWAPAAGGGAAAAAAEARLGSGGAARRERC